MTSVDFNVLAFIWLGFFFVTNMVTVGTLVFAAKRGKPMPDCAGAIIVPAFVILALVSFLFVADFGQAGGVEVAVILSSALFLMLWEYFAPKTQRALKIRAGFIGAVMLFSFLFLPTRADFGGLPMPALLAILCAALFWLWLMYAFAKMKEVSEVVVSESSFIAFAVLIGAIFLAFLGKDEWGAIGVIAGSLGVVIAGFRNWSKAGVWPKMTNAAIIPVALVLGWLLMKAAASGMWAFALILPLYFFVETGYSFIKKHLFKSKSYQPFAIRIVQSGAIVGGLRRYIFRSNLVLLMVALLALSNAGSGYLLALGAVFAIYELYRMSSWGEKQPSIREITSGLFREAKAGYREQKAFYSSFFKNLKKKGTVKEALLATGEEVAAAEAREEKEKAQKPAAKKAKKPQTKKAGRSKKAPAKKRSPIKKSGKA